MKNEYHILNGDALKALFPSELSGHIIVARECLVDGLVESDSLDDFFQLRASFLSDFYEEVSIEDYFTKSVSEFRKIQNLPEGSQINLWFEDDLFCQVNFWFVTSLILNAVNDCKVYLIRPQNHTSYGFGGLNNSELLDLYSSRVEIRSLKRIASLWYAYQKNSSAELMNIANELYTEYPFIRAAVQAHIERIPNEGYPGRPIQTLTEIMSELGSVSFGVVFKEFCKRESIYGFGDMQVKRWFDEIKKVN